jgi:transposase
VSSHEDRFISTPQRLPGPPRIMTTAEGRQVLGVGIALGTVEKTVIEQFRIEHGPAGVDRLIGRCLALEPDPAEVRVVLETRHGLLVEALLDAGFTVVPVNPDLVARRRGPARKKDDAEDARICCLLALDRHAGLKALIPHGELGGQLRAIVRDDNRAARDQRRLLNRLRADLQTCGCRELAHPLTRAFRPAVFAGADTRILRCPVRTPPAPRSMASTARSRMGGSRGTGRLDGEYAAGLRQ